MSIVVLHTRIQCSQRFENVIVGCKFTAPSRIIKTRHKITINVLINLQATKPFIVTSATKGGWLPPPVRFSVGFKILYRVIQPFIQHCLLHKMVYLNIIYIIATRNCEFFTTGIFP